MRITNSTQGPYRAGVWPAAQPRHGKEGPMKLNDETPATAVTLSRGRGETLERVGGRGVWSLTLFV